MSLENSLMNYSFLTLLISVILVWFETLIPSYTKDQQSNFKNNSNYCILISNILLSCLLIVRWKESGHFPLSNLYESLMFLSWCFTAFCIAIFTNASFSNRLKNQNSQLLPSSNLTQKLVSCVAIPCALLCNAFASFTLSKEMQEASPLVPALQSNWLMMHVSVMILSYAALILGSLMSIAFLIVNNSIRSDFKKIALMLDNLSYRILALGFPLLTIGILSGAVWANEAWGSYWSWDPKETWALLTWLVFAVYLHARLSKDRLPAPLGEAGQGKKPAIIASFGFFIVWMCYLGVNLLGEGLHSYGWIVKS
jgi:cytochrome c-type biogenesis protein CcsB